MDPMTTLLLAKTAAGVAQGVGTAIAAKKMKLTRKEQEELDGLERRKRSGDLGLSEAQRGGVEQRFLAEQAGVQRQLQAQGLQEAAARGLSGGVSGRELFLSEQAKAKGLGELRQQQNIGLEAMNQAAARDQEAQIAAMRAQQREAKAMRVQGITAAVTGGLSAAGDVAGQRAQMKQQVDLAEIDAAARAESTDSMLRRVNPAPGGYGFGAFSSPTPTRGGI